MNSDAEFPLTISADPARLDRELIHRFLAGESAWARGIPRPTLERAIDNSLCFGAYLATAAGEEQVGFARVITDRATFANLVDVFILPQHRGRGIGKRLLQAVLEHPDLQGLRRFTLATADAHSLYSRFGFAPPAKPQTLMERYFPGLYAAAD